MLILVIADLSWIQAQDAQPLNGHRPATQPPGNDLHCDSMHVANLHAIVPAFQRSSEDEARKIRCFGGHEMCPRTPVGIAGGAEEGLGREREIEGGRNDEFGEVRDS